MSVNKLEKKIVDAINREHGKNFKVKDMMEWGTHVLKPQEGEEVYYSKEIHVYAAFKIDA